MLSVWKLRIVSLLSFSFDISKEKEEKGKKRSETKLVWKKKLIENTHSLVVSKINYSSICERQRRRKLYCLELDGDELADGVVGISKKFFLLHRFCL